MYELEIVALVIFSFGSFIFLKQWYSAVFNAWPFERNKLGIINFGLLPIVSLVIITYTLKVLASFDVVNDIFYIYFYIAFGFAWIYLGLQLMFYLFDLSWVDDALNLNNKAALFAITGGFIGLTIIYAGANIGDGPGWWCVVFAGGLGLISWFVLGLIINYFTNIFERITVDRDVYCGIRLGLYFLASGIILGRASSGDWTSFLMTIVEFMIAWPVLPLVVLFIIIERYFIYKSKTEYYN